MEWLIFFFDSEFNVRMSMEYGVVHVDDILAAFDNEQD